MARGAAGAAASFAGHGVERRRCHIELEAVEVVGQLRPGTKCRRLGPAAVLLVHVAAAPRPRRRRRAEEAAAFSEGCRGEAELTEEVTHCEIIAVGDTGQAAVLGLVLAQCRHVAQVLVRHRGDEHCLQRLVGHPRASQVHTHCPSMRHQVAIHGGATVRNPSDVVTAAYARARRRHALEHHSPRVDTPRLMRQQEAAAIFLHRVVVQGHPGDRCGERGGEKLRMIQRHCDAEVGDRKEANHADDPGAHRRDPQARQKRAEAVVAVDFVGCRRARLLVVCGGHGPAHVVLVEATATLPRRLSRDLRGCSLSLVPR
mmetsp:Transcript_54011/g.155944  ORF Transcript_54011/g.155944 Transcript_54011/m.155944 type:complete len:315 (-) Transcript_54011:206-1150(-)